MKTILVPILILSILCGCATAPQTAPSPQRTSAVFDASKDTVWPLLIAEVGLNYPVQALEKESGLITTDWVSMPAGYNNKNATLWVRELKGPMLATWNGLRMNMRIMAIETEPGKTMVRISCHYEGFEKNISKRWLVLESNGAVENSILTRIEQQLRR